MSAGSSAGAVAATGLVWRRCRAGAGWLAFLLEDRSVEAPVRRGIEDLRELS